jgi:hypothetical protein
VRADAVQEGTSTSRAGNVVTVEPGVYLPGDSACGSRTATSSPTTGDVLSSVHQGADATSVRALVPAVAEIALVPAAASGAADRSRSRAAGSSTPAAAR